MTMEEACADAAEIFPNPERLDKIAISMSNLQSVVRERNRAYHLLETGETGERPGIMVYNRLGKINLSKIFLYVQSLIIDDENDNVLILFNIL